jgi:uncharacterized protein YgiM (DUF1202 family)
MVKGNNMKLEYTTIVNSNMRSGAGTKHSVMRVVSKKSIVVYIGKSGNWYKVCYGGLTGYIYASLLKRSAYVKNNAVKELQEALQDAGYYGGKADSIYGQLTAAAVAALQAAKSLPVTGIADDATVATVNQIVQTIVPLPPVTAAPQTEHFKVSEFACKDGSAVPVEYYGNLYKLMLLLEEVRAECGGKPMIIVSGYRSPEYNEKLRAKSNNVAKNSQHLTASAADVRIPGVSIAKLYAAADKINQNGGVGKYSTFAHIDPRGYKARW